MDRIQKNRYQLLFKGKEFRRFIKYFFLPFLIILLVFEIFINSPFIINVSNSLPRGIYKKYKITREIKEGDLVLFVPNKKIKNFLSERNYQNIKIVPTLIKKVIGTPGDEFKYKEIMPKINIIIKNSEEKYGIVFEKDSKGIFLPRDGEIKLQKNEYYVVGTHIKSFDSRYFGAIKREEIKNFVKPIFLF